MEFKRYLMHNILSLHRDLINGTWRHGGYHEFKINDPKPRTIHKACVRDRLLHHAVYRILYPFFDRTFTADSYSCRNEKGSHRAMNRFLKFARKVSCNNTQTCWILKCDIRKFFANIDHGLLMGILRQHISDQRILALLQEIISSFNNGQIGIGLPLGNLTSQLFSNIYLNQLDQFVKHRLKVDYYIRYADDFVILHSQKRYLEYLLWQMRTFLRHGLYLDLHPDKIYIKTLASGMDFLGWEHFFHFRVLRTSTKARMMRRLRQSHKKEVFEAYMGLLSHGDTNKLKDEILALHVRHGERRTEH